MYDVNHVQIVNALETCKTQLKKMEEDGILQNKKVTSEEVFSLITGSSNLSEALSNSFYIQVSLQQLQLILYWFKYQIFQ